MKRLGLLLLLLAATGCRTAPKPDYIEDMNYEVPANQMQTNILQRHQSFHQMIDPPSFKVKVQLSRSHAIYQTRGEHEIVYRLYYDKEGNFEEKLLVPGPPRLQQAAREKLEGLRGQAEPAYLAGEQYPPVVDLVFRFYSGAE